MTELRTELPFALAANAGAENVHDRSASIAALQRISRFRSFKGVEIGEIQTALSLRPSQTIKTRDEPALCSCGLCDPRK